MALLASFFTMTAQAVSFETDVQGGLIKKNSIATEHFRFEFSDLILDQSDSDSDGISDTIELLAETAELSYDTFVDDMGYEEPNQDSGRRTVVILDDRNQYLSSGALGITSILSSGDPYVAIDPFLSEDLLRVTMAHEFYHVLQFDMGIDFAYYDQGINWAEATATWSEEFVHDDINDYLNYLQDYFDYPDYSVFAAYVPTDTLYEYALNIWPRFLSEYYDEDLVLAIWDDYQSSSTDYDDPLALYESVKDAVEDEGGELDETYTEFALWNLDLDNYSEGASYPDVLILSDLVEGELTLADETFAPALYGTNYLYFPNSGDDDFYFQLVKPEGVEFSVSLVPYENGNFASDDAVTAYVSEYDEMGENLTLENTGDYDAVVAVVSALDADFDEISDPEYTFDEGYLYYYLAQYGEEPEVESNGVELEETEEKEGEEPTLHEDGSQTNQVDLDIVSYDEESVTLSWTRPDSDITLYDLWYWTEDDVWVETFDKGYYTNANIDGLEEGETYTFQIFAYDEDNEQVGLESVELSIVPEEWVFTDLSFLDIHYEAISSLVDLEVFRGYPDGSFQPNGVINRAELLKILIEGRGIEVSESLYKNCFPDVGEDWYAKYVCYAEAQDWVSGYPDGTFRPGNTVNKVEALKILFNVYEAGLTEGAKVSQLSYPDLDVNAWYAIYVWKASNLGILEETPGDDFVPTEGRTRGDMAEELYRYLVQLELI